jgi:signal transduction histidine kinase
LGERVGLAVPVKSAYSPALVKRNEDVSVATTMEQLTTEPTAPLQRRTSRSGPSREDLERLRARLHDTTLQTLEFIASGGPLGPGADLENLMRVAAREATELRECLQGLINGCEQSLVDRLEDVVAYERCFATHQVRLAIGATDGSIRGMTAMDLAAGVREALTNARKHSGASEVVVRCDEHAGAARIEVQDNGIGTDLSLLTPRLGVRHSILARTSRLGGHAELISAPGRGMCVVLTYRWEERPRGAAAASRVARGGGRFERSGRSRSKVSASGRAEVSAGQDPDTDRHVSGV